MKQLSAESKFFFEQRIKGCQKGKNVYSAILLAQECYFLIVNTVTKNYGEANRPLSQGYAETFNKTTGVV